MTDLTNAELIEKAKAVLKPRKLSGKHLTGDVASALVSAAGNVYAGVCADVNNDGFCAEVAAIAAMLTAGESIIAKIAAVWDEGQVLPPCGRCREFMHQIDIANLNCTLVVLGENQAITLKELLPHAFTDVWAT